MSSAALSTLAGLVLEDGRTWGEVALDFQLNDARAVCAPTGDTADAPRRHFQVRPRGAAKTSDAAGVALALLVTEAPARSRSYVYAVDRDQATELLDALTGYVERTPGLAGAVEIGQSLVTVRATQATLRIEASDGASAFNKRPWLVVIDELASWPDTTNHRKLWGAIVTALPKRPDSRLLVLSMAGSPHHPAFARWQHALSSRDWRASHVPGPCPWWLPQDVEAARGDVTESEFRRYILAEWVEADDALSTAADVLACVTHDALEPHPGTRYVLTLDIGTRRDFTALAVSHAESTATGRVVVVDRVLCWRPRPGVKVDLDEVEAAAIRLSNLYNGAPVLFDRMQAEQLVGHLARQHVRTREYLFTQAGTNRLARSLYTHLRDRALRLPDDPELISELSSTRLVETGPGTVKLVNPPGTHDDLAVVVGMACAHLTALPEHVPDPFDPAPMLSTFARVPSLTGARPATASPLAPLGVGRSPLVIRRQPRTRFELLHPHADTASIQSRR